MAMDKYKVIKKVLEDAGVPYRSIYRAMPYDRKLKVIMHKREGYKPTANFSVENSEYQLNLRYVYDYKNKYAATAYVYEVDIIKK